MVTIGTSIKHAKHGEVSVSSPCAQYEKAIDVYTRKMIRSRLVGFRITPRKTSPPMCVVIRGTHDLDLRDSGMAIFGLSDRPDEWQQVQCWANEITEQLASQYEVIFDWRDYFKEATS